MEPGDGGQTRLAAAWKKRDHRNLPFKAAIGIISCFTRTRGSEGEIAHEFAARCLFDVFFLYSERIRSNLSHLEISAFCGTV